VETPELDEAGSYKYTKTRLKVIGYFTLDTPSRIGVYPQFNSFSRPANGYSVGAGQQFSALKQYLEMPRRRLIYSVLCDRDIQAQQPLGDNETPLDEGIGTPVFIINPATTDLVNNVDVAKEMDSRNDVHGGPFPQEVSVVHVANNTVWRVEFTVEFATIPRCTGYRGDDPNELVKGETIIPTMGLDSQLGPADSVDFTENKQRQYGILGHRWSCVDRINDNGYTTRTYTGSVSLANPHWHPNDFRLITVPPIIPGMMRKSIDYVSTEDNLTLRYNVTDEEVTIAAPELSRNIHITHNEAVIEHGAKVHFTVKCLLTGDRKTRKYDLMQMAQAIVEQRLFLDQAIKPNEKASCLIHRWDYTTEQGSDQGHSLSLVVSGERHAIHQEVNGNQLNRAQVMSRSLCWRPVKSSVWAVLADYNNTLSRGSRSGEQPDIEGEIPAITIIHSLLSTVCTKRFGAREAVSEYQEVDQRKSRIEDLKETQRLYDTNAIYGQYPNLITVEINDNVANGPVLATYSTAHQENMYSHYNITSTYGINSLKVALPVAVTTATSGAGSRALKSNVVVGIGPRQPTRKIHIEAERVGKPPRLPDPIPSFTEAGTYTPGVGTAEVVNTLIASKTIHLNPAPVADGTSLLYTSYLDMEYSQDSEPAKHRFGIPDTITPTDDVSPEPLTDAKKYNWALGDIFINGVLNGLFWNN
jgi:hypothetical protein